MGTKALRPSSLFYCLLSFGAVVLALVATMRLAFGLPIVFFTRDISVIASLHPLAGSVSSLGAFFWCASAATCFFTLLILRSAQLTYGFGYLLSSGLLSIYLMFDDFFVIHEYIAPEQLGISQHIVLGTLALAVLVHLIAFRNVVLNSNYPMLVIALIFFALSVVIDQFLASALKSNIGGWEDFIEDGFKLLGILCWYSYFVDPCRRFLLYRYT